MICFEDVRKTYPRQVGEKAARAALKGVSFRLGRGETLGLIGQNGAGKSTSIRLIMDFIRPDEGRILILGSPPARPEVRARIGYLPETFTFPENLTCGELLDFAARCAGVPRAEAQRRARLWLERLGIPGTERRLLRGFSKGMRQRASFAAALIHDPELLILDEPMSGLDPLGREDIIALISELQSAGKSILFCSHLLDDVQRITRRVAVLHRGRILFDGETDDFCGNMALPGESAPPLREAFIRMIGRASGDQGGRT